MIHVAHQILATHLTYDNDPFPAPSRDLHETEGVGTKTGRNCDKEGEIKLKWRRNKGKVMRIKFLT